MAWTRKFLDVDVLSAARDRIRKVFDDHAKVCVSFSGGKDSGVLIHLVMDEAIRRGQKVTILFIDWEAQYDLTIQFVRECFDMYRDYINPLWVCVPLRTVNACSVHEPEWICWDPKKRDSWVREIPEGAIHLDSVAPELRPETALPFYRPNMTFEDFIVEFESWFQGPVFVGIRAAESYDRYLGTFARLKDGGESGSLTSCPLYDWKTEDVWTYYGKSGKPYNRLYDRMYQAGVSIHRMRVCEPYGNEQRRGLWMFHEIEPGTWPRICARVAGVNCGSLYSKERGNILGNQQIQLPPGHTWESFSMFLLSTMPPSSAEHYKSKIATYLKWYQQHGTMVLPDTCAGDMGAEEVGSWKRICRTLLRNDFWCTKLGFSPTKTHAYQAYLDLMKRRRETWGLMK